MTGKPAPTVPYRHIMHWEMYTCTSVLQYRHLQCTETALRCVEDSTSKSMHAIVPVVKAGMQCRALMSNEMSKPEALCIVAHCAVVSTS